MRNITVRECFESLIISDEKGEKNISQREANALNRYAEKKKLGDGIKVTISKVTFVNYVGVIKIGSLCIEVLPKLSIDSNIDNERKNLLKMILKCKRLNFLHTDTTSSKLYKMNIIEILSYIFANELQKVMLQGMNCEYINIEENCSCLKGKIIMSKHIKNIFTNTPKVYCSYEEFSQDNTLNQILYYCTNKLLKTINSHKALIALRQCQMMFEEVTIREITKTDLDSISFNRLNERYKKVFTLAKMILEGLSSAGLGEGEESFSLLFKMNVLFEEYMWYIASKYIKDGRVHRQQKSVYLLKDQLTEENVFLLKPDIVIEGNKGKTSIIIDTKWKMISSKGKNHGVKESDIYQMYAYLTKYEQCKTVVLLYPGNDENVKVSGMKFNEDEVSDAKHIASWINCNNSDKIIKVYTISLKNEEATKSGLLKIVSDLR